MDGLARPLQALLALIPLAACSGPWSAAERVDLSSADELRLPSATGELFAFRTGDPGGPRVIFLHGTPGSADAFAEYLMEPLPGFEYVSVDRPGHGHSEPRRAVADLERQAEAVAAMLPQDGRAAILVGHSYGAPVAAWLASTQPDRVAGLVLIAGSVAPEHEKRRWYNWVAGGIDWLLPHGMAVANDEIWPLKAQLEELAELAPRYTGDLVVIHGTEDGLVPYANATWAMEHFSGARSKRLVTIEDEGHFILWSHRSEIEAELEGLR